jgi:hypothetical protein
MERERAVISLKENPKLASMMGENGRKYVESEASIDAIRSKMIVILKRISLHMATSKISKT